MRKKKEAQEAGTGEGEALSREDLEELEELRKALEHMSQEAQEATREMLRAAIRCDLPAYQEASRRRQDALDAWNMLHYRASFLLRRGIYWHTEDALRAMYEAAEHNCGAEYDAERIMEAIMINESQGGDLAERKTDEE